MVRNTQDHGVRYLTAAPRFALFTSPKQKMKNTVHRTQLSVRYPSNIMRVLATLAPF